MAIEIHVEIPQKVMDLDSELRRRSRLLLKEVTDRTAERARENVGHDGPLAHSIKGNVTGDMDGEVVATARHAKAQEEGAYIVPRRGKKLKFRDTRTGEVVFTRGPVRIKPKRYMKKARSNARSIINAAFRKVYGDLLD
jgi:hypothetical protein